MKLKIGKLQIATHTLDSNSHGPNFTTLTSTVSIVPLGRQAGKIYGWRFYIYWKDGSNWAIDFTYARKSR